MRAIVDIDVPFEPRRCFEFFSQVDAIPRWVPEVKSVQLLETDAEGRPRHVEYLTVPSASGEAVRYVMAYVYEEDPLAIEWFPRTGHDVGVNGHAVFSPIEGGCRITYVLAPGRERPERADDRAELKAQAKATLDRFATELRHAMNEA